LRQQGGRENQCLVGREASTTHTHTHTAAAREKKERARHTAAAAVACLEPGVSVS